MAKKKQRYLYDHPFIKGKKVTRQRLYQIRKRAEGFCPTCGNAKTAGKAGLCDACDDKSNERRRVA